MSRDAIKAGKAWVELSLRDKIDAGLARAQAKLKSWGMGLAMIGGAIDGVAAATLGGLAKAAQIFANMGSEIFDMSAATGVGAETLSALGYGADQTGVSLEALNGGLRGLAKFTLQVATGNKTAIATLEGLGIASKDFLAASPEQRLGMIADVLKSIEDPGLRAGIAMKLLGKSGTGLLPMLKDGAAGLQALTDRARELGLVITDEEAAKADALGDAWTDVQKVFQSIAFKTGAALAETLTTILTRTAEAGAVVGQFVRNNQALVMGLAMAAVVASAVGAAFLGLAVGCFVLSALVGGLSAALVVLNAVMAGTAAVVAFIASPLGIIIALVAAVGVALIAGAVYFAFFTETGQAAIAGLMAHFNALWQTATTTLRGIFDAIVQGNWQLAGDILMAGLNAAFVQGIYALQSAWEGFKAWLWHLFADLFSGLVGQIAAFHDQVVATVNAIRADLGMDPVKGLAIVGGMDAAAKAAAAGVKSGADQTKDKNLADAYKKVIEAQDALNKLVRQAADDRAKQAQARSSTTAATLGSGLTTGNGDPAMPGGSAIGAFNAAVKGLLHDSGTSAAERTAKNTEDMKNDLAKIREEIEDGGLVEVTE